jgi:hypothetical protein
MDDNEELMQIPLTQGKFAIIDKDDYDKICDYKWFAVKSRNSYYAASHGKNRETIKMHRVILGLNDKKQICDHIDHNGLNNSKFNLRVCTDSENAKNTTSRNGASSKYLGVSYSPIRKRKLKSGGYSFNEHNRKWLTQIQCDKKKSYVGRFATEIEAAIAYNKVAIEKFGSFANVNKI